MLSPMVPHLAEELWEMLGHSGGLARVSWPEYAPQLAAEEQVEIVVQINGRVRTKVLVESELGEEELLERVQPDPHVAQLLKGQHIVKRVVVPNKLVNFVLG